MKPLLSLLFLLTLFSFGSAAQSQHDTLPYLKYPTLPAFNLISQDSSKVFNMFNAREGRPIVLFFFSPDCEHCQVTTTRIMEKMDSMQNADFYFFTFMPLSLLRPFAEQHHLNGHKNIMVGKDYQYFFPQFYGATTVPYIVVYDRHKKFVKLYENSVKTTELIALLNTL